MAAKTAKFDIKMNSCDKHENGIKDEGLSSYLSLVKV